MEGAESTITTEEAEIAEDILVSAFSVASVVNTLRFLHGLRYLNRRS
jgi:hypothetical protein